MIYQKVGRNVQKVFQNLIGPDGRKIGGGAGGTVEWDDIEGKPSFGALATRSNVTSTQIQDGTIVNADVSANAGIALSKLASVEVNAILVMTQAEYDAVVTKDPNTLYVVS